MAGETLQRFQSSALKNAGKQFIVVIVLQRYYGPHRLAELVNDESGMS